MLVESMTHSEVYRELDRDRDTATTWWQHDRDAGDERWTDFDHVKELLRLVLENHMHSGESDEVLAELDQQVRDAWRAKK